MGNDMSVAQFREQARIITSGKPPNSSEFWKSVWTTPVPLECVFGEITPGVLRYMKRKKPVNLIVLISQAKDEILQCATGEQGVIRCLEVLTHVMPVILEPDERGGRVLSYAGKYLFSLDNRFCLATGAKGLIGEELLCGLLDLLFEPNFTVNDALPAIDTTKDSIPINTHCWAPGLGTTTILDTPRGKWVPCPGGNRVYERRASVLRCLLSCLCGDLYIAPSAPLPSLLTSSSPSSQLSSEAPSAVASPVVAADGPNATTTTTGTGGGGGDANGNSAATAELKEHPERRFVEALLNSTMIMPQANAFFFSLINTVLSYDPVGWGLPYNYLFTSDAPERLTNVCAEVLAALLVHKHGVTPAPHESHPNYFIQIIRKLKKKESFSFLYSGIVRLLESSVLASDSMFPYARHQMRCAEEVIIILFIMCFYNRKFVKHILSQEDLSKLMLPLLHYVVSSHKDNTHHQQQQQQQQHQYKKNKKKKSGDDKKEKGVDDDDDEKKKKKSNNNNDNNNNNNKAVSVIILIFLILSEDREFGNVLNTVYTGYVPSSIVPILNTPSCTLADIFILSFCAVLSDVSLDSPVTEGFLNVLSNASPYLRDISSHCSEKLCSMFIRASRPSFIAKKKLNHRYAATLLDIISKIIGYEPQGSSNLIYSLVCYKNEFLAFRNLTFEALRETKEAPLTVLVKPHLPPPILIGGKAGRAVQEKYDKEKEDEKKMNDALYGDEDDSDVNGSDSSSSSGSGNTTAPNSDRVGKRKEEGGGNDNGNKTITTSPTITTTTTTTTTSSGTDDSDSSSGSGAHGKKNKGKSGKKKAQKKNKKD